VKRVTLIRSCHDIVQFNTGSSCSTLTSEYDCLVLEQWYNDVGNQEGGASKDQKSEIHPNSRVLLARDCWCSILRELSLVMYGATLFLLTCNLLVNLLKTGEDGGEDDKRGNALDNVISATFL
jgi:hypothetical protein